MTAGPSHPDLTAPAGDGSPDERLRALADAGTFVALPLAGPSPHLGRFARHCPNRVRGLREKPRGALQPNP